MLLKLFQPSTPSPSLADNSASNVSGGPAPSISADLKNYDEINRPPRLGGNKEAAVEAAAADSSVKSAEENKTSAEKDSMPNLILNHSVTEESSESWPIPASPNSGRLLSFTYFKPRSPYFLLTR